MWPAAISGNATAAPSRTLGVRTPGHVETRPCRSSLLYEETKIDIRILVLPTVARLRRNDG